MIEAKRCKLITCILPNDGTDTKLQRLLKSEKKITRTTSLAAKGLAALAEAKVKSGMLPEPVIVKMVRTIVDADQADEIFDYIYHTAEIGRAGGGVLYLGEEIISSAYDLPQDLPEET